MDNIEIASVCGLCAGCKRAINTTLAEINQGKNVIIFKEIVHNRNVNAMFHDLGARVENNINNLSPDSTVIIRAHGEPPVTYAYLNSNNIRYVDCTCPNVARIHEQVREYKDAGYQIVILGKHHKTIHPEVLGTLGWADNDAILIENEADIDKLREIYGDKVYLVCQTTFNMDKADKYISLIENIADKNNIELVINRSICNAQRQINISSLALAKKSDVMIVVGGKNSSNSIELYNNVRNHCPSIFIEDINDYLHALREANINIDKDTKIGITAGASTRKEELSTLKQLIISHLKNSLSTDEEV